MAKEMGVWERQEWTEEWERKTRGEKDHVGEGCLEVSGFYCNGVVGFLTRE